MMIQILAAVLLVCFYPTVHWLLRRRLDAMSKQYREEEHPPNENWYATDVPPSDRSR